MTESRTARSLGVTFIFAGVMHFLRPKEYRAIMPPYIPAHAEMVAISGAGEIIGGVAALFPRTHGFCRVWLTALLILVFPANVHMAVNPDEIKGLPDIPRWLLWARLPFQGVFIAWVIAATRSD